MIRIENTEIHGFEPAIRGMRNPMNSWDKSDSEWCDDKCSCQDCPHYDSYGCNLNYYACDYVLGNNDLDLMKRLASGGSVHAKYRRMITVWVDITAPLYWWKEFDTYKVGTVANSCSTMHKIHSKEFELDDFSHEYLLNPYSVGMISDYYDLYCTVSPISGLHIIINVLNVCRRKYLETKDKKWWWQMIQLLPSSYNQKRTIMLNYEVLHNIYISRKDHKLDEWHEFCDWIKDLPYSEIITGQEECRGEE